MSDEFMDVTPHGRVLSVFGELKVPAVYCLAELIDNAFDDFWKRPPSDLRPAVTITLPGSTSTLSDAEVWVVDNGLGMDRQALNNAVRAGWTSNSRYEALGLFGMGLNIATAGLGWWSEIWTTRAGDPSWTVVTLDLSTISAKENENYQVPLRHAPKDDPSEHGTKVIIKKLRPDQFEVLKRQARTLRDKLGHIYSHLLTERAYLITVNRTQVNPRRACVWGENRSVSRGGAEIRAVIRIDETLPPRRTCVNCGRACEDSLCPTCGSERTEYVERRIWGWLGIQRYLHKSEYGVDFLRSGRKIMMFDKNVFDWVDPDGLGAPEREYPIDSPRNEGRIIGEIHCDHVPVNYTKTSFELDSAEWKTVLRVLRGESPLRPNRARQLGLATNDSPLGRLFTGYRREDPGLRYLVPGDGKNALRDKAIEWTKLFRDGHPEYQSDEKWYEAARLHDSGPTPPPDPKPAPGPGSGTTSRMGLDDDGPDGGDDGPDRDAPKPETRDQHLERYRASATEVVDMAGRYEADGQGAVELKVWVVPGTAVEDHGNRPVPVFVERTRPPRAEAFVAADNALFTEYGVDFRELVLVELAEYMRQRAAGSSGPPPLSAVLQTLRVRSGMPKITPDVLAVQARRLLDRVREAMQPEVAGNPSGYWELLPEGERALTERRFALEGGADVWDEVIEKGDFVLYIPASAVVRLIERRPGAFLDNRVFRRSYATLTDEGTRGLIVSRLAGYISDLALLVDDHPRLNAEELARSRISCRLVERELADTD
ncbi:ATP-binding protein [Micromonospora sp. NPDC023888]|uniref:ATP-binding protein n=1 Tax=Micromonospora sp. NPDC023888 TaxID=3155607 RepID=UPI0034086119